MGASRLPSASEPWNTAFARRALTSRENEVLQLILARYRNPEIADHLVLSVRTVESHIAALFRKFGVTSRHALIEVVRADERERLADEREHVADEREHTADRRERVRAEGESLGDERLLLAAEHAEARSRRADQAARRGDEHRVRGKEALARAADRSLRLQAELDGGGALADRFSTGGNGHTYQVMLDGDIIAEAATIDETVQQLRDRDDLV